VVTGDYDEQRAVLEELSSYATGVRAALFAGGAQVELARLEWKRGQWRAALARRPEILSWMERAPSIGVLRTMSSSLFARVHNDVGQPGQALEHLQATLSLVRSQNEAQTLGPYLGQMARALAAKGRGEEAAGILQELLEAVQDIPYVHRNSVAASVWRRPMLMARILKWGRRCRRQMARCCWRAVRRARRRRSCKTPLRTGAS
jgi:tetratricopeptide (TPR) repeat protein